MDGILPLRLHDKVAVRVKPPHFKFERRFSDINLNLVRFPRCVRGVFSFYLKLGAKEAEVILL